MTKKQTKKTKEPKTPPTLNLKREVVEVSMDRIRFPEKNPARTSCDLETVERYHDLIVEYMARLRQYQRSKGTDEKPTFPLPRPKLRRTEPDDDECDLTPVTGCHTLMAAVKADIETIEVEIYDGSEKDMLILAIQDNAKHGLSYTPDDYQYNILNLKAMDSKLSCREIANILARSKTYVADTLKADREQKTEEESLSASGQTQRSPRTYNQQRFLKSLLGLVTRNLDFFTDSDAIELAKTSGRIIQILEKERPDIVEYYYDSLQVVVDPDRRDFIDYDGGMLFVDEEKAKVIEEQRRALEMPIDENSMDEKADETDA